MNLEIIYSFLRESTDSHLVPATFSKKEWVFRCPLCQDSKNKKKGHLYISSELFLYHCFRCDSSGTVKSLLHNLAFTDRALLDEIKVHTRKYSSKNKEYNILQTRKYQYTGIGYKDIDSKLSYLKLRLGENFITKENMDRFRVIPSVSQFLKANSIEDHKLDKDKMKWLDERFIGFMCFRGAKIVFRSTEDNPKIRYYVGKLFDEIDVYAVPSTENQLDAIKRNKIVLAEGPFDIINSYQKNILDLKDTTSIFVSVLSKAYVSAHWLTRSIFGLPSPSTVLLLDSDMSLSKKTSKLLVTNNIRSYKNSKGKDFGSDIIQPVQV